MLHVMRTSLKDLRSALRQVVCWMLVSKDCSDPEELVLRSVKLLIIPAKVMKNYLWLAPFPNSWKWKPLFIVLFFKKVLLWHRKRTMWNIRCVFIRMIQWTISVNDGQSKSYRILCTGSSGPSLLLNSNPWCQAAAIFQFGTSLLGTS